MPDTVVIQSDNDDGGSTENAAAEANAHLAERAEENAEEAAEVAEEAAVQAATAAELSVAATDASMTAAGAAAESAGEARSAADDLRDVLTGFKDDLLSSIASVMNAREEQVPEEEGGIGVELSLDAGPPVEPDEAPTEQHPYYRKWGRNR